MVWKALQYSPQVSDKMTSLSLSPEVISRIRDAVTQGREEHVHYPDTHARECPSTVVCIFKAEEDVLWAALTQLATTGEVVGEEARKRT